MRKQGKIFVISGPSGSGKTTLLKKIIRLKGLKNILARSVSLTTRPKRSGERGGRDYFFIQPEEFKRKLKAKKILEWTKYLGYYYATPKDFIDLNLKKGKNIILCLDLKGAFTIRRLYPQDAVTIFVLPPSITALRQRIGKRCAKTAKAEINQRLALAKEELCQAEAFDYCLVNEKLGKVVKELREIIVKETG